METEANTTVDSMRAVALWRARSGVELTRLRALIHEVKPLAVYCTTVDTLVIVVPKHENTVELVSVSITEYPCIAAHVAYYGDGEVMSLLHGNMAVENLPKYLHNTSTPVPQEWCDFMVVFAELSAPRERE